MTAALQSFIDGVPNGTTIVFKAGGTYRITGLTMTSRTNLTFEGNGATLRNIGWTKSAMTFSTDTGITVRNLTILGDNPDAGGPNAYHTSGQEYSHGISLRGTDNVDIGNVTIDGVWGDGVFVGSYATYANWSDHIRIHNSTIRRNGRNGVTINAGSDVIVSQNSFDKIAMHAIDLEPDISSEGASDVTIQANTFGSYGTTRLLVSFLVAVVGVDGAVGRNIIVTGNTVTGGTAGYDGKALGLNSMFSRSRLSTITFTNNQATGAAAGAQYPGAVLYFKNVDGLTVTGNVQPLSSGQLLSVIASTAVTSEVPTPAPTPTPICAPNPTPTPTPTLTSTPPGSVGAVRGSPMLEYATGSPLPEPNDPDRRHERDAGILYR